MTEPALEISELRKNFGGVLANDGINLVLSRGEIHGLIGPNGSGKTTLIAQIMGELTPDSGEIRVFGKSVTALPVHAIWVSPGRVSLPAFSLCFPRPTT